VSRCRVNGVVADSVPVADRGLQYGDGLFETLRLVSGRPRFLSRHLARLAAGCRQLGFAAPEQAAIEADIAAVAAETPPEGVVKLIVTRGAGGRGYRPGSAAAPTRVVLGYPPPGYDPSWWNEGIELRLCATRLGSNPRLAGIKHLNRLEQVLARAEWDDAAIPEGLMLDDRGRAVCGTQANLFVALGDRLVTPSLDRCGVAGVMRGFVLEHAAAAGIDAEVREVTVEELAMAREIFVTNAVIGIWPVSAFADRSYAPGRYARLFQRLLAEAGH
jgi:4-amino-4-deoxychorismate lyase